jgi:hypothetical protein
VTGPVGPERHPGAPRHLRAPLSEVLCLPPRKGIFHESDGQDGPELRPVQSLLMQDFQAFLRPVACQPVHRLVPACRREPCPTRCTFRDTWLDLCLNGAFSNPLRPHETSARRRNAGRFWACPFRRTKLGGPIDRAGQVPQRDALRTIGQDRAGPGIYPFQGICRKPHSSLRTDNASLIVFRQRIA